MTREIKYKLLDSYFAHPVLWDVVMTSCVSASYWASGLRPNIHRESLNSLLSELISSSIAIGGFVIASLTIVLTIKDNVLNRNHTPPKSGIDLLFDSRHYQTMVSIYNWSAVIFLLAFLYFSGIDIFYCYLDDIKLFETITIGILIMALTLGRCLWVLSMIVGLHSKNKTKSSNE